MQSGRTNAAARAAKAPEPAQTCSVRRPFWAKPEDIHPIQYAYFGWRKLPTRGGISGSETIPLPAQDFRRPAWLDVIRCRGSPALTCLASISNQMIRRAPGIVILLVAVTAALVPSRCILYHTNLWKLRGPARIAGCATRSSFRFRVR